MHRAGVPLLTAAALTGLLGACGGDDKPNQAANADVTVVAEDSLKFDKTEYSAPAGAVTIEYEAGGTMTHTLLIQGIDNNDFELRVSAHGTDTGTVDLEPGDYQFYCDIPGHESMKATLTVE